MPQEDRLAPLSAHVAVGVRLGSLLRKLVEDHLCEAEQGLPKRPSARTRPRGHTVLAHDYGVQRQARVLQQPGDERMVDWDEFADARLQAQLQSSE